MLRFVTWCVFAVSALFGLAVIVYPIIYKLREGTPHYQEIAIVWFVITVAGFIPAVILAILARMQQQAAPPQILRAWAIVSVWGIGSSMLVALGGFFVRAVAAGTH